MSLYRGVAGVAGVASPMIGYGLINGTVFFSRSITRDFLVARNGRNGGGQGGRLGTAGNGPGVFGGCDRGILEQLRPLSRRANKNVHASPNVQLSPCWWPTLLVLRNVRRPTHEEVEARSEGGTL